MATVTETPAEFKVIGTRPVRPDGIEKVTGRAIYGADVRLPGMVYGAMLRSPHAHARIKSIDTSQAEVMAGVLAVIIGTDMPDTAKGTADSGEEIGNIGYTADKMLARKKVGFKGHPVAAVAAVDLNTAIEATKLIKVEYEVLKPVLNVDEAMAPGAPIVLEDLVGDDLGEKVPHTNVGRHFRFEFGDLEAGFKASTVVVEREFNVATVHQGYIESHASTALWQNDGKITIWTTTQGAFGVRRTSAGVLMLPESRIKVIPTEIGGGFGGKLRAYLEPVVAMLSKKCGRPVQMVMDRRSVFDATGPSPAAKVTVKLGADSTGRIRAATADLRYEAGAYPGSAVGAGANCIFAAYRIENSRIDGYDVVVNKPQSAAYRAPGATQATFAMECAVDEMCLKLQMDPLDFRIMNGSREGDRQATGPTFMRIGNLEVQLAAKESPHYKTPLVREGPDGRKRGRGVATGYWNGGGNRSSVNLSVNTDGTVALVEGSVDIGGTRASIAMQAAEALGIPMEDVRPSIGDTEAIGYNDMTGGSRTTYASGYAAIVAAQEAIQKMTERAAKVWEIKTEEVEYKNGAFSSKSDPQLTMTFKQVAAKFNQTGGPLNSTGSVQLRGGTGSFGSSIVDVEVDTETGKVDVTRYTVIQDAGKAIHPSYVEGQMQGGAVQGIGWALNEEYYMNDQGIMENATLLDYRMPTSLDVPMIETIIVEVPNPNHPYGVRGVGETAIVHPVPAIANAICDALGVRLQQTPMKPGRVLEALEQKRQSK